MVKDKKIEMYWGHLGFHVHFRVASFKEHLIFLSRFGKHKHVFKGFDSISDVGGKLGEKDEYVVNAKNTSS